MVLVTQSVWSDTESCGDVPLQISHDRTKDGTLLHPVDMVVTEPLVACWERSTGSQG